MAESRAPLVPPAAASPALPTDIARLFTEAHRAQRGEVPAPVTAAHPQEHLYSCARPAIASVIANQRLTGPGSEVDLRHLVLSFGDTPFPILEGQSIGVQPPGADAEGRPHHVRLYWVASPRDGERPGENAFAILVRRLVAGSNGSSKSGVTSNHLCDLSAGDEVAVSGPFGRSFLMPDHPGAKLLFICAGAGVAPVRAMIERRRRLATSGEYGKILLLLGARSESEVPYFGTTRDLPPALVDVELCLSREPRAPREHVQDRLRSRADHVARLLRDEQTYIYLCGHRRLEAGVLAAFEDICRERGLNWHLIYAAMRARGRFHIETY